MDLTLSVLLVPAYYAAILKPYITWAPTDLGRDVRTCLTKRWDKK